ncbi:TIGR02530 family flagellar biosynthesis protein [Ornithinibacillus halophilus]|uniref:Flagellar operon protein n=1 Tax=Ornithinibacillus halophilus TaxID=930117 RepID=A0A1M5CAB7_9BACI|nr:TIGR02530 family flagellar biosynthesis protein [Ornithinibacillus halophilus]SHF51678.1 flagellar operon protein [Ornithinibacillus halophilus]
MDHRIHQIPQHHALQIPSVKTSKVKPSETSFKDILQEQQQLKVSKHANDRLNERNIQINDEQWKIITEKVSEARTKGITDSLVVTSNAALLVSAKNNVVVTAMDRTEAKSKIFTNINGTILIDE